MAHELNKDNAMLWKWRRVLDIKSLSSVYYAIFESHLCYALLVLVQSTKSVKRVHLLQNQFLRIMFCWSKHSHTVPLFKVSKILKSIDKAALKNCIFISKSLKWLLLSIFNNWFEICFELHFHDTRWSDLKNPLTVLKPMADIQCL